MSLARALKVRSNIYMTLDAVSECVLVAHMLFAVLTTFYWCKIIGAQQLDFVMRCLVETLNN